MFQRYKALAVACVMVAGSAMSLTGPSADAAPQPQLHPTGALPSGPTKLPPAKSSPGTLPASVDLTQWAMPVGDQGQVGSCVTWAINYSMMGWYANHAGHSFVGAPMYVYSQIHATDEEGGGGSYPSDAFNVAASQGVDTQSDYTQGNYDYTDLPTNAERANAANYKTGSYHYLYNVYGPGVSADDAIRGAIAAGHPVALMLPVYAQWDALNSSDWTLDANDIDGTGYRGLHEVTILGYDAQGVRIENQWGTYWGQNGWANLDWNFIEQYTYQAAWMDDFVNPTQYSAPSAPTSTTASVNSSTTAMLSWQAPTSDGGSPITGYRVARDGTPGWSKIVAATARSQQFTLTPGTTYNLSVSAINAVGTGPASSAPVTMPNTATLSAPQGFHIVGHKAQKNATVSWTPPASNGGSAITGYKITRSGSPAWSARVGAAVRSKLVPLKVGVSYTLSVRAITAAVPAGGPAASGPIKL